MEKQYNIILDPGHGGVDEIGTYVTAPNKMYVFPDGTTLYEGEINRKIIQHLANGFRSNPYGKHRIHFTVHPLDASDVPLRDRTNYINQFNPKNTICLSIHNNAFKGHNNTGSGFEAYTYFGQTNSDILSEDIYKAIKPTYEEYGLPIRTDKVSDGDSDKEIELHMTRETLCPTVLLEYAFFDNYDDAKLLQNDNFLKDIAFSTYFGIMNYLHRGL